MKQPNELDWTAGPPVIAQWMLGLTKFPRKDSTNIMLIIHFLWLLSA